MFYKRLYNQLWFLTLGEMEDWSKVEELVTAGNLMGLGIFDFNGIAQCLGNDTLGRYMVYEYFD